MRFDPQLLKGRNFILRHIIGIALRSYFTTWCKPKLRLDNGVKPFQVIGAEVAWRPTTKKKRVEFIAGPEPADFRFPARPGSYQSGSRDWRPTQNCNSHNDCDKMGYECRPNEASELGETSIVVGALPLILTSSQRNTMTPRHEVGHRLDRATAFLQFLWLGDDCSGC